MCVRAESRLISIELMPLRIRLYILRIGTRTHACILIQDSHPNGISFSKYIADRFWVSFSSWSAKLSTLRDWHFEARLLPFNVIPLNLYSVGFQVKYSQVDRMLSRSYIYNLYLHDITSVYINLLHIIQIASVWKLEVRMICRWRFASAATHETN